MIQVMRLEWISISNVLSFGPKTDFAEPTLDLRKQAAAGPLAILVGANGSGKSALIDVIATSLTRGLCVPYDLNDSEGPEGLLRARVTGQSLLKKSDAHLQNSVRLPGHWGGGESPQAVRFGLRLTDVDKANMDFVLTKLQDLQTLARQLGADLPLKAPPDRAYPDLLEFELIFHEIVCDTKLLVQEGRKASRAEIFAAEYLKHFRFLQQLIAYRNGLDQNVEGPWPPLRENVRLIGAHRDFGKLQSPISLTDARLKVISDSSAHLVNNTTRGFFGQEYRPFDVIQKRLAYELLDSVDKVGRDSGTRAFHKLPHIVALNDTLAHYVQIELSLGKAGVESKVFFEFRRVQDKTRIDIAEMSSGERAIVQTALLLHAGDLAGGLLLVDEPEIHLHPQLQRQWIEMVVNSCKRYDVQAILATHSPGLVTNAAFGCVYRCYRPERATIIRGPAALSTTSLLLDFDNAARALFVHRVLLVEGATDVFFICELIKWLSGPDLTDLEVLAINGKTNRNKWKIELEKLGGEISYLGDLDAVTELGRLDSLLGEKLWLRVETEWGKTLDPSSPPAEVFYSVVCRNADAMKALLSPIEKARHDRFFILQHGCLENYLGLDRKASVDDVAQFCQKHFAAWVWDPRNFEKLAELTVILYAALKSVSL